MNKNEIIKYLQTGTRSAVCVSRSIVERLTLFVISIYITGSKESVVVSIEFDPINIVDEGEGWIIQSKFESLDHTIVLLEKHLNTSIDGWENVTKTGKLSEFYGKISNELYQEEEDYLLKPGRMDKYLPHGFKWHRNQ